MPTRRVRELVWEPPSPHYMMDKARQGWTLVALEWERETDSEDVSEIGLSCDVPYGLRLSSDSRTLEEDPQEREILTFMLHLIVKDDMPFSKVTQELNGKGFRTRSGFPWSQSAVFDMLPRLVEVAPTIFSTEEWALLKHRL
jgi:hypothetical protein